jgi:cytidylate kinase
LGFRYLDTGALYRALTWWMLERGIEVEDGAAVTAACNEPQLESITEPAHPRVSVDGLDVTEAVREPRVAKAVSAVSRVPAVRERLVALQRRIIGEGGIVVEGRDIGTVVAADADVKIFLVADPEVRAVRRAGDLGRAGDADAVAQTQAALARRDELDSTRAASPLARADDAIEIDTSAVTLDEVVSGIVERVKGLR